jgi:hypothetical protein
MENKSKLFGQWNHEKRKQDKHNKNGVKFLNFLEENIEEME